MQKGDNPYDILDVPQNCDYLILRKAYRKLALATHPERKAGDATRFAKIANAYELVGDPTSRHNYDLQQRFRDRSRPNSAGYDPDAPDFPYDISEQYDPSQPDQSLVPNKTIQTHPHEEDHDMSERGEETVGKSSWVTYTVMEKGKPVTKRRATKVYSRSPRKGVPLPKATRHSFQIDPLTMFQEEFPEGWKPHAKMKRSTSADSRKKKSNASDSDSVGSKSRRKSKKKSTEAVAAETDIATPLKVRRSKRRGSCASDGKAGISTSIHSPSTGDNFSSPRSGGNPDVEVVTHSGSRKLNVSLTSPNSKIVFSPAQKNKMKVLSAATTPKSKISGTKTLSLSDFVSSIHPGNLDDTEPGDDNDDSYQHDVKEVTHSGSKKVNVSLTSPNSHLIFSPAQKNKMKAMSAVTTSKSKVSGIQPITLSDIVSSIDPGSLDDSEPGDDEDELMDRSTSAGNGTVSSTNLEPQSQDPVDNQSVGSKGTKKKKKQTSETKKSKPTSKSKKPKKKSSRSSNDLEKGLQGLTLEQGMASIMQGEFADSESSLVDHDKVVTPLGSKTGRGSVDLDAGSVGGKSKKKKKEKKKTPTVLQTKKKSKSKSSLDDSLKVGEWEGSESSLREDAAVVHQLGNKQDHSPSNNSYHSSSSHSSTFASPRPRIKYHRISQTADKETNPQPGKRIIRPLPPDYNSDSDSVEDNYDSDDDHRVNHEESLPKAKNMVLPLPPDYRSDSSDSVDDDSSDDDEDDHDYYGGRQSRAASSGPMGNQTTLASPKADPVRFVYKNGKRVVLRPTAATTTVRGSDASSPIAVRREASESTAMDTSDRSKGNAMQKRIIFRNGKKEILPPDSSDL